MRGRGVATWAAVVPADSGLGRPWAVRGRPTMTDGTQG